MIFTVIAFFLIFVSFINYKRAFLLFLCYKIFLVDNVRIQIFPYQMTVNMFLTLFFLLFLFLRWRNIPKCHHKFPFKLPFCFVSISWLISSFFSYAGFVTSLYSVCLDFINTILFVWMIWILVDEKKDLDFLVKWMTFLFILTCVYAFYEYFAQTNPLMEYEKSLTTISDKVVDWSYDEDSRGYRVQSVFSHPIGGGTNWSLFIIFVLTLIIVYNKKSNFLLIVAVLLCIPCVFVSNSRGPIFFLLLGSFAFINVKSKKFYILGAFLCLFVLFILPLIGNYADNILSIFDSKANARVAGGEAGPGELFEQLVEFLALLEGVHEHRHDDYYADYRQLVPYKPLEHEHPGGQHLYALLVVQRHVSCGGLPVFGARFVQILFFQHGASPQLTLTRGSTTAYRMSDNSVPTSVSSAIKTR